jgi:predicted regulator of Ras-like GTPase activity (Roadblock/LC7/MglB family)
MMSQVTAILEELQRIQRAMTDISSMSIIDRRGVIIASTMVSVEEISSDFGEAVYTFFTTARELAIELHKGAMYQLMIREQKGITFVTEINTAFILLTTTSMHVKYSLMEMELKRIAADLDFFVQS